MNLRCAWWLGCPVEIRPLEKAPSFLHASIEYKSAFRKLLPGHKVPSQVGVACCAQFGITGETVRRNSKAQYLRMREWLLSTNLTDATSGRILEYSWHSKSCMLLSSRNPDIAQVIFGKKAIHCPEMKKCYCNTFGICDDSLAGDGSTGQWVVPPSMKLPKDWPYKGWYGEPRSWSGPL